MAASAKTQEGFVTQLLDGDYRSLSEDRLTQLAAASFNQSRVFCGCFLRFLRVRGAEKTANVTARTQWPVWRKGKLGRLDLVITRGDRPVAIVENKVDAPLHARQLRLYSGVPALKLVKKIALVRHYFELQGVSGEWRVLHWRDFYLLLCNRLNGKQPVPEIDRFVIRNFIQYLEAAHMHVPHKISRGDMNDLARTLQRLRFADKTDFKETYPKSEVFETASDWIRMMESVFEESRLVTKLTKAARKKYRFSPCISHWQEDEARGKENYRWISISWEISFSKPRRWTKGVGLGLFVDDKGKWTVDTYRHVTDSTSIDSRRIMDGRGDVVLAKVSKKVLKTWQQWLP
jgi:hypothetical protein